MQGAARGRSGDVDGVGVCGGNEEECGVVGVVEGVGGAAFYMIPRDSRDREFWIGVA